MTELIANRPMTSVSQPSSVSQPGFEEIQQWLSTRIASLLKTSPNDIDAELPFSFYGLDSVAALGLSGDLENWLKRPLDATLTWDYPTISLLAQYLSAI